MKLGYFFLELSNFRRFFTLTRRQSGLSLEGIPCCTKGFNAGHDWVGGAFRLRCGGAGLIMAGFLGTFQVVPIKVFQDGAVASPS